MQSNQITNYFTWKCKFILVSNCADSPLGLIPKVRRKMVSAVGQLILLTVTQEACFLSVACNG